MFPPRNLTPLLLSCRSLGIRAFAKVDESLCVTSRIRIIKSQFCISQLEVYQQTLFEGGLIYGPFIHGIRCFQGSTDKKLASCNTFMLRAPGQHAATVEKDSALVPLLASISSDSLAAVASIWVRGLRHGTPRLETQQAG